MGLKSLSLGAPAGVPNGINATPYEVRWRRRQQLHRLRQGGARSHLPADGEAELVGELLVDPRVGHVVLEAGAETFEGESGPDDPLQLCHAVRVSDSRSVMVQVHAVERTIPLLLSDM